MLLDWTRCYIYCRRIVDVVTVMIGDGVGDVVIVGVLRFVD